MRRTAGRIVFVSVIIFFMSEGSLHADEGEPFTQGTYAAIGAGASTVSGIGLSFGVHLPNPILLRITGGGQTMNRKTIYSLGGEVHYDLSKARFARFYVVGGGGVYHLSADLYQWGGSDYTAFGAGIGGEIALGYKLVNHLSIGGNFFPMVIYSNGTNSEIHPGVTGYFAFNF